MNKHTVYSKGIHEIPVARYHHRNRETSFYFYGYHLTLSMVYGDNTSINLYLLCDDTRLPVWVWFGVLTLSVRLILNFIIIG